MGDTAIPYLDKTWNITVGCSPAGEGCRNCYARELHEMRHTAFRNERGVPWQYCLPFERVFTMPERLGEFSRSRLRYVIGVCFMSDLFHADVPDDFLHQAFDAMEASGHTYVLLTKRHKRLREYLSWRYEDRIPSRNIWAGVTVWDQPSADAALPDLLQTPAAHHLVSYEPALAYIDWHGGWLDGGRWRLAGDPMPELVIAGCESGKNARWPERVEWYRMMNGARHACEAAGVTFYLKQAPEWSRPGHVLAHPLLDGRQHVALPWRAAK